MDEATREDLAIYVARYLWKVEQMKTFKEFAEFVDTTIISWEISNKWGQHQMLALDDITKGL